ncbi:MAG: ATP synthase subunit I [Culicoidibacterales bacterium]
MNRELQVSFQKTMLYSFWLCLVLSVLGTLWQPENWLSIWLGSAVGTTASGIATYLLYHSATKLLHSEQEQAVQDQMGSYAIRFCVYIIAMLISIAFQQLVEPLFVIIGFLLPKIAMVIEAYTFNRQGRR